MIASLRFRYWVTLAAMLLVGVVGPLGVAGQESPPPAPTMSVPVPIMVESLPADGTIIQSIKIEGLKNTFESYVLEAMDLKPGQPFLATTWRRDVDAITLLGAYDPLSIALRSETRDDGLHLVVQLRENPRVSRIDFVGNMRYSTARLTDELDFKVGGLLGAGMTSRTQDSLESFYRLAGYKAVRVRAAAEPDPSNPDEVVVRIVVDEGERVRVRDLHIEGNSYFPDVQMRFWLTNAGSWLFFRNYYDDVAMDEDLRIIASKYRDAGFLDATAVRGPLVTDPQGKWVDPTIIVTEGVRYRIKEVAFENATLFTREELREPFLAQIGKVYNGTNFREALDRIRTLYGDQGYRNLVIDGDFDRVPASREVTLRVRFSENDVVKVGDIKIRKERWQPDIDLNAFEKFLNWSSPGVTDQAVEREIRLKSGEKFRTVDEVRTVQRLKRLGFFESVQVQREPTDDPRVDNAIVDVKEDPAAGFIGVTAGVGESAGASVGVNYTNPNLFGDARVLKVGGTLGTRVSTFSVGYLDRAWREGGEYGDDSLELNGYATSARYEGYRERIIGASAEVGRPLTEYTKALVRLRVENVDLKRDDSDVEENMRTYQVYAIRGLWVRDKRDDERWTTSGTLINVGLEPGYARDWMLKLTHRFEGYRALDRDKNWVYAYQHTVGLMPHDADQIGISERFFLGGTSSVRGFAARGIGPVDRGEDRMHIGGATAITQRHELRHRFTRFLRGRLFVDGGMLEDGPLDFGTPRVGTGAGISFDLGAFVVNVDLGFAAVKKDTDKTRVLHLGLRSNF